MRTIGLTVALMAALISCSGDASHPLNMAEFERNRELWTVRNVQNYKMLIGAFGVVKNYSEQVLIEVRNRKTASMELLWQSGGAPADPSRPFDSIEKIFEFVADQNRRGAKRIEVQYHPELGYPNNVVVDQDGQQGNDDDLLVRVKRLEMIE